MKLTIEIPKEFIQDFQKDKFAEFFGRVKADIDYEGLCGLYEKETAEMLKEAFQHAECSDLEIDWHKVPIDTPILVKTTSSLNEQWQNRHFAGFQNNKVYAWSDGGTSWTSSDMCPWDYAKLMQDPE